VNGFRRGRTLSPGAMASTSLPATRRRALQCLAVRCSDNIVGEPPALGKEALQILGETPRRCGVLATVRSGSARKHLRRLKFGRFDVGGSAVSSVQIGLIGAPLPSWLVPVKEDLDEIVGVAGAGTWLDRVDELRYLGVSVHPGHHGRESWLPCTGLSALRRPGAGGTRS